MRRLMLRLVAWLVLSEGSYTGRSTLIISTMLQRIALLDQILFFFSPLLLHVVLY